MVYKIGAVVQLASGGPEMTVIEVEENSVRCRWFDGQNNLQEADFDPATLVPVSSGPHYLAGGSRPMSSFR